MKNSKTEGALIIKRKFVELLAERLRHDMGLIQVVLGPRQIGKTTGVKQLLSEWHGPALFVSADEEALPDENWIRFQWERAKSRGKETLFVVDEIQKVHDWSRIIKVLFDKDRISHPLKIILLGSASLKIQKGLTESLMGRYETTYVPHWTFEECKSCFGWSFRQYLLYGGYPASAALITDQKRWKKFIRDAIIEPVITQDLLEIADVYKPALFRQCFELAMSFPAQEISLQKLLGQLQENGNVSTIKHYLDLFEGAFLLRTLQKYSGSVVTKRSSSPKILPLNTALVQGLRPIGLGEEDPDWYGRLFECIVGTKLTTFEGHLYYWREGPYEVDFVLDTGDRLVAVEAKSGRRSHFKGLMKFCADYPHAEVAIIDSENIESFLGTADVATLKHL